LVFSTARWFSIEQREKKSSRPLREGEPGACLSEEIHHDFGYHKTDVVEPSSYRPAL
jgi:hypothetical protein